MKKIFTLICMAAMAMSANAQGLPENVYPIKDISWGDITWKVGNNKTDIATPLYFVNGQGNAYKDIYCESFISEDSGDEVNRPYYTYVYYWQGITGVPNYGLYYKFTPAKDGKLKVAVWANKGNRATTVVPASTGTPLVMHTDYTLEGYINGKSSNTTTPIYEDDGVTQKIDNDGNPMWVQAPTLFDNAGIKELHDAATNPWGSLTEPDKDGNMPDKWNYVIGAGNQAFWGWITFDVKAGESYYVFQASSQLGFGGYDFTPTGGEKESNVAAPSGALATEFASIVDANGKATNVNEKGSVVTFGTANISVEAVGSSTPTAVTPDKSGASGIEAIKDAKTGNANAPVYNLAGQRVSESFKGVVIQNGQKRLQK